MSHLYVLVTEYDVEKDDAIELDTAWALVPVIVCDDEADPPIFTNDISNPNETDIDNSDEYDFCMVSVTVDAVPNDTLYSCDTQPRQLCNTSHSPMIFWNDHVTSITLQHSNFHILSSFLLSWVDEIPFRCVWSISDLICMINKWRNVDARFEHLLLQTQIHLDKEYILDKYQLLNF